MSDSIQSYIHDLHPTIKTISLRLSSNSEANASELLGNLDEMFSRYYIHNNELHLACSIFRHIII